MSHSPSISIIIPVLNEADRIGGLLDNLQPARDMGHEIIVVDGGSLDNSVSISLSRADRVILAQRGRASQMIAGVSHATGDYYWFLHADSLIGYDSLGQMLTTIITCETWGFFPVRLDSRKPLLGVVACLMSLRSRLTAIATGDQGIFVSRRGYHICGGYRRLDLMEDIDLSKRLRRIGEPVVGEQTLLTSARKWENEGVLRTILLMWRTRASFFLGADPQVLASRYYAKDNQ